MPKIMPGKLDIIDMSDNLLKPEIWVAQIRRRPNGLCDYAIQFVGIDEGKKPNWRHCGSIRIAKSAIKEAVKRQEKKNAI